jgi:hypothetical protein
MIVLLTMVLPTDASGRHAGRRLKMCEIAAAR